MPRQVNFEKYFAQAKQFSSRADFSRRAASAYQMLYRHKMLDKACAHMTVSPVYSYARWTPEAVFVEAAKYANRAEFKRQCSGAYCYALDNGILAQACSHMRDGQRFWHVFELMAVAIKYQSQAEFINEQKSAYKFCKRENLVDIVCAHMERRRKWFCKADVLAEAARHKSRGAFQAMASGAFKQAYSGGYLDEACAHMPPPEYGFSKEKPANLYHLRITAPGGVELFKIGITNRDPLKRIAGMGLFDGVAAEVLDVIQFASGRDARITEKRLHSRLSGYRYAGDPVMKNGKTELFTVNMLEFP